jgi:flagellar biosynthesis/type III secretory pathway chaperone
MKSSSGLADVLAREADLYEDLLGVLEREEAALIAGDTRAVGTYLARTETLVLELRLLETSRETLVAQLTGRRKTRLSEMPAATSTALVTARARLSATLPRVERMNRRVTALLERSLKLFEATMDLVRETAGLTRHYTADGVIARTAPRTIDGRV